MRYIFKLRRFAGAVANESLLWESFPKLFFSDERAAFSAAFFDEADLAQRHLAVDGLAHIVDRKPGDRRGRHRFHLDAGLAADAYGRLDLDARRTFLRGKVNGDRCEIQRMAHGN